MKITLKKILIFILILSIIFGVFFRFYNLNYPFFCEDDAIFAVSSLKIHHQGFKDGVQYVWNHPPLGKYLAGILTKGQYDESFKILSIIPPQMFGWAHLAFKPLQKTILNIRLSYFFFGILILLFVFLLTNKIYSTETALWATVLTSLSLDFISFSRNLYPEQFMIFFTLACSYFYINYLYKNKNKVINLILFAISLLFLLGSRQFQPVMIAFFFLFHYIGYVFFKALKNKVKFSKFFYFDIIFIYIVVIIITFILYNPLPPSQFTHSGIIKFGFQFHKLIGVMIFRNSYLSLIGLILTTLILFQKRGNVITFIKNPNKWFKKDNFIIYMFTASFLSMLFFNFPFVSISRYSCFILIFLIIIEANTINKLLKSKRKMIIYIIVLIGLLLTFNQLYETSRDHPPFILNSNFNIDNFALMPDAEGVYNHSIYEELNNMGSPSIITNIPWLATYYTGETFIPPLPNSGLCSKEYFELLKKNNASLVIYDPIFFTEQNWASCESFRQLNFQKTKTFKLNNFKTSIREYNISIYKLL